jgi:hypothetical protein
VYISSFNVLFSGDAEVTLIFLCYIQCLNYEIEDARHLFKKKASPL